MAKRNQLQKQKKRQERIRVQRHIQRYGSLPGDAPKLPTARGAVPQTTLTAGAFIMEKQLRTMHKAMQGQEFKNASEANAYLRSIMSREGKLLASPDDSPQEQAQDLAYEAMSKDDPAEAVACAKEAVELDPACVDALVVLAIHDTDSLESRIQTLQKAVEAGERALGEGFLEGNRGRMWGMPFARPYMRGRVTLGEQLMIAGRHEEARDCFEETMDLNPSDNQGVRFSLLGCYLVLGALQEARTLLKQFDGCMDETLLWGKVMLEFLSGHLNPGQRARRKARRENPYVEEYLLAEPETSELTQSPGEREEAKFCARMLRPVVREHPELEAWLRSRVEDVE